MEIWLILLIGGLIFIGLLVLVLYDRGIIKQVPFLEWTGMGYDQITEETHKAKVPKRTVTYTVQPRKTLWDLLQLFLVPLVLAVVAFAFNAGQASSSQQLEDQSAQEQVVNTYLDQMSNLVLQNHLHDSQLGDPVRAIAQALTLTALSRLDSEHKNIIILFLYRADLLKYHYYMHNETDCGDPNVLKKQFQDELPIITLSQGNIEGVSINNLSLRCIDLHNMYLKGSDFSTSELDRADLGLSFAMDANFSYASMIAANLYYLDLENANLQGAKLDYANMEGVCLSHAQLVGADLQYADLRGYTHAANYATPFCGQHDNSTFTPANLSDAVLSRANFSGADLSQANLSGADLSQAHLTGANLSGANLSGTTLDNTVLKGARYNSQEILVKDSQGNNVIDIPPTTWSQGFDPKAAGAKENNTLNGANLSGASLPGANLGDTSLLGVNLSGADLTNAFLWAASLNGANLSGASLRGADLIDTSLWGANLSGANLINTSLRGASLNGANLSGASLNGANFTGVSLLGVDLSGANLSNAKITRAQLKEAKSLKNAIMPNGLKHP